MTAASSDVFRCPNMSELTHFGEHGPNTFSTSSIPILEKKRHANNDRMIMSVDLSYEPERDMNCLDILAGVVSRCSSSEVDQKPLACAVEISRSSSDKSDPANPQEHRVSCHRCGNIRKRKIVCERPQCPHIFCGRCADKMRSEHGADAFLQGCPVCREICCCVNKTVYCNRKNHCYRKCPASKTADHAAKPQLWDYDTCGVTKQQNDTIVLEPNNSESTLNGASADDYRASSDAADYHYMPLRKICLSKNGSLDFLAAAVSIMDGNDLQNSSSNECIPSSHQEFRVNLPQELRGQDLMKKRPREGSWSNVASDSGKPSIGNPVQHIVANRDHSESLSLSVSSKFVRTAAHISHGEFQPPPAYFLAQSLLPAKIKQQVSPGRNDATETYTWRQMPRNNANRERRLQIGTPFEWASPVSPCSHSSFISNNSSPISRCGDTCFGATGGFDYISRERYSQAPLSSVSQSQNIKEVELNGRMYGQGPRGQDAVPHMVRSKSSNSLPLFPLQHAVSAHGYFKPIGSLSSQLLPPPL